MLCQCCLSADSWMWTQHACRNNTPLWRTLSACIRGQIVVPSTADGETVVDKGGDYDPDLASHRGGLGIDTPWENDTARPRPKLRGKLQISVERFDGLTVVQGLCFMGGYQPPDVAPYVAKKKTGFSDEIRARLEV